MATRNPARDPARNSAALRQPDVYFAIADPTRRRLLDLLAGGERSVQDLMKFFDVTIGAISQHLKVLLDCGLVERRKQGRFRFYRARPVALEDVHAWTEQYQRFWDTSLDRLEKHLDENP